MYLRTMRSWADSLTEIARSGSRVIWLRYRTYARPGTHVDVLLPEGRRVKAVIGSDQIAATLNVRMESSDSTFPPSVQRVLDQAATLDFYLPDTLSGDLDFARRTGLADCVTASMIVVSECQQRGVEARMAGGLILAPPLGTVHQWAEIRMGDIWAPADPLLLRVLVRFAGLDSAHWSCTQSPTAILLRLADCEPSIVDAADGPVETSFVVSVGEQSSPTGAGPRLEPSSDKTMVS